MPVWWNWQTRWTQNPVSARTCGFDPRHRHQTKNRPDGRFFVWCSEIRPYGRVKFAFGE